ncbi:MAG: S41 family peptidase [Planctomycetota bacterium]
MSLLRPRTSLQALLLSLLLLGALGAPAQAQLRPRPKSGLPADRADEVLRLLGPEHLVREAWRTTKRNFYAPKLLQERNWDQALDRALNRAKGRTKAVEVHHVISDMLGELQVSHLALLEFDVWQRELAQEFKNRPAIKAGCELSEVEGRYYACGVSEQSPAAKAGLLDGDEVVRIDGRAPAQSPALIDGGHDPGLPGSPSFSLRVSEGQPLKLTIRRRADAPLQELRLVPAATSLIESARASVRVEEVDGRRIGVMHLWHFIHPEIYRIAERALTGPLRDADALVLDVRGRGGSAWVVNAILGLFRGRRAVWNKPVVVLTDAGTRSAKEIFAHRWKQAGLGPIVGERTQGACIACQFFELSDGSVLCLPIKDVRSLTGGVDLEGKGVEPDLRVTQLPLPYRAGEDRILKTGLRRAAELAGPTRREAF